MALAVRRSFGIGARDLAAASRAALDVPLVDEAELWIARPAGEALAIGAFQRNPGGESVRRGSGGPTVRMGEGTLWVALLLPRVDALVACDEAHLFIRYVRARLRSLTRCGALAHFFGRDWGLHALIGGSLLMIVGTQVVAGQVIRHGPQIGFEEAGVDDQRRGLQLFEASGKGHRTPSRGFGAT